MQDQARTLRDSNAIVALSISPDACDHDSLDRILTGRHWKLYKANDVKTAEPYLEDDSLSVVLCRRELKTSAWTDVLDRLQLLPCPPRLIVTSRLADERLWAEALNLGAWDVLATPFNRVELIRSVHVAWEHWRYRATADRTMRAAS